MIAGSIKAKLLVFAIFFMGIATGVLIANFYTTRVSTGSPDANNSADRTQRATRDINKFYDYLGLDEKQREQMRKIGEETRHEFQELRKETQPRFEAITEESRTKIRAVLNDEQRNKYDEFRRKMEERRRGRGRDNSNNNNKNDHDGNVERGQRPN
jgi:Spy/CpxP family protein refolding chaperone